MALGALKRPGHTHADPGRLEETLDRLSGTAATALSELPSRSRFRSLFQNESLSTPARMVRPWTRGVKGLMLRAGGESCLSQARLTS